MQNLCYKDFTVWNEFKIFDFITSFKPEEFSLLCGLTSWATCGTGRPREDTSEVKNAQKDLKENNEQMLENPHNDRYGRLGLSRKKREEIGRKSKRFLDMGRCDFIENQLKLKTKLAYYVDSEITLENVVLIASKWNLKKWIPISRYLEIVILYTEILTRKVVLWCFFSSEKIHNSTFQVKISV